MPLSAMPALMHEAFKAAFALLPPHLREEIVLVGRAALLWWNSPQPTQDLDIAASSAASLVFYERVQSSPAFASFASAG